MTSYCALDHVLAARTAEGTILLNLRSKRCFGLNRTGAAIWRGLERGQREAELVDGLCRAFDVSPEEAGPSLTEFLAALASRELIRESPG